LSGGGGHKARGSARHARAAARSASQREQRRARGAVRRILAYTPYVSRGSPRKREVALTFDDGPSPYTARIVRVLRRERATATFFVVGQEVAAFATGMATASRAGFPVGDHTQTHPRLAGMDAFSQRRQLEDQQAVVKGAGVPVAPLFRPPFGSYDATTLRLLRRKRMLMVLWSVDTDDYTKPGVQAIVSAAVRGAQPGAIILLHDGGGDRSQTVAALPQILRGLRRRRLEPVTILQLVADDPPPRRQGMPPTLAGG
jgi:peptidoglycan-N-acetylglucosamine deacetylase